MGEHAIEVSAAALAPPARVYGALADGTLLRLTGADTAEQAFGAGGAFRLAFAGRGVIHGVFVRVAPDLGATLAWHVEGFGRPPEHGTTVDLEFTPDAGGTRVRVRHAGIGSPESAAAKRRAWTELLADLARVTR
jgi:uncharacterized protein YndB with AHSA1/START domain